MNQNDSDSETIIWLNYSLDDLKTAKLILSTKDDWIVPRNICYLCQQAVEKAIKAIYVSENQRFHKIHDLDSLKNNLPDSWKDFGNTITDLSQLSDWAIEGRYPGDWNPPNTNDAMWRITKPKMLFNKLLSILFHVAYPFRIKSLKSSDVSLYAKY
jgi:HEPN domain-containing protein